MTERSQSFFSDQLTLEDLQRIEININNLHRDGFIKSQRIKQVKSLQQSIKESSYDQTTFRPEINKKSQRLNRCVRDLYQWKEIVDKKRMACQEKEKQLLHESANQQRQDFRKNQPKLDVFSRLYSSHQIKQDTIPDNWTHRQNNKNQNNWNSKSPSFTKSMNRSQAQQYNQDLNHQQTTSFVVPPTSFREGINGEKMDKSPISGRKTEKLGWKPCLPNCIYYSNKTMQKQSETIQAFDGQSSKQFAQVNQRLIIKKIVDAPQQVYMDVRDTIEEVETQQSEEYKQIKQTPHSQQQADDVVQRLNNWQNTKINRLQSKQEIYNQRELDECTFQPNINRRESNFTTSDQYPIKQQKSKNYSNIYNQKLYKMMAQVK